MQITGEVRIGEAAAYGARACAPLTNAPWPMLMTTAASAIGGILAVALGRLLAILGVIPEPLAPVAMIVAGIASIWLSIRLARAMTVRNFRRNLLVRGIPNPIATAFEVTPQALICRSDCMEYRADWRVVTDVLMAGPYWVALAQAHPLMLPRRFFVDEAAERAFIRAILQHLEPAARARSRDALRFAGDAQVTP